MTARLTAPLPSRFASSADADDRLESMPEASGTHSRTTLSGRSWFESSPLIRISWGRPSSYPKRLGRGGTMVMLSV